MTKFFCTFLLFLGALNGANSQTDTLPPSKSSEKKADDRQEEMAVARIELRISFLRQDSAATGFWLDSLGRLGTDAFAATLWDERWLLYHWLGRYPQLLEEVAAYPNRRVPEGWLAGPPEDSLFKFIDEIVYEQRLELFDRISRSDLNAEDRLFSLLHLEFLLRIGSEGSARLEQDQKLENFVSKYPESRFQPYIRKFMYEGTKPGAFALGLDFAFAYGNWTDQLARTLTPYFGVQFGLYYWKNHWTLQGRGAFGRQRLDRVVPVNNFDWPDNDPVRSTDLSFEIGRDIVDQERLRIFPTAGIGVHFLNPPSPGEDEDPYPQYYDNFYFTGMSLTAALTTDLKFPFADMNGNKKPTKDGYHGVRLRVGYSKLNFGRKNDALAGNLIFFAVGYNLFGPQSSRRSL